MSWLFCCFKTLSVCGLRDCMINTSAFQPPEIRKYSLKFEKDDLVKGPTYKMLLKDQRDQVHVAPDIKGTEHSVVILETKTRAKIPALFIENKNCRSNMVILYSHGNSTDLGRMMRQLQELSEALNVHVFAYEYNGYGPTQGPTGEIEVLFGIMAAYEYLTQRLGFKWHYIVLYGRSIGSGPSVFLASHPDYPVSGVILHSPIASGFRVFDMNFEKTDRNDIFPNCDFIGYAKAHVFIMHGEADTEVSISHGKMLAAKCQNAFNPWWVSEGDHHNIDYTFKKGYFMRIGRFLRYIYDFNLERTSQEIYSFYKVAPWWSESDHVYFKRIPKVEENYKKYIEKNGKKTLRDLSFVSGLPLLSEKSISKELHSDDVTTADLFKDSQKSNKLAQDDESKEDNETKAYSPPQFSSNKTDLNSNNKEKAVEIEFSSFTPPSKIRQLSGDLGDEGPREVKYMGEQAVQKNDPNLSYDEETTIRPTEATEMRTLN